METPAPFSSATPEAYRGSSKFQVAGPAYHHSATQECVPPAREARRCSPSPEGECQERPGPAAPPSGRLPRSPRSPRSPGSAVPPAAQPAGRRWAAEASAEAWRLPPSPTHVGGAAAGVTAPEERPRARVRRHPGGPGPQGGGADRAARPRDRTAPHALPRGG